MLSFENIHHIEKIVELEKIKDFLKKSGRLAPFVIKNSGEAIDEVSAVFAKIFHLEDIENEEEYDGDGFIMWKTIISFVLTNMNELKNQLIDHAEEIQKTGSENHNELAIKEMNKIIEYLNNSKNKKGRKK